MQKEFLSICLLLALLSPVTSLDCFYCHSQTTSCEGGTGLICDFNRICVSGVLENNIVSMYKVATYRGCSRSKYCHSGDYSISSANGKYLQMKVFCCGTWNCNMEPLYVPPRKDLSPNGLECPACFGATDLGYKPNCESQGTVSCLGNETKCIDYSGEVMYRTNYGRKLKLQGCATEDVCALKGKMLAVGHLTFIRIVTKCSDAKKASEQIVLEG